MITEERKKDRNELKGKSLNRKEKKIAGKRVWYLTLFMALNLIEWLRATQTGDIWMVAVNCMGLVIVLMIMGVWPMKKLFTWYNGLYTLACMAAMGVVYWQWALHRSFLLWKYLTAVMNVWGIGILVIGYGIRLARKQMKLSGLNVVGILWVILTVIMVLSVSGRLWPVWFFFLYGTFYLTEYGEGEARALMDGMVNGTILSFMLMQCYAFGFRPYDEVRYKGPLSNCNMTALYYLIVYCMVLLKIHFLTMRGAKKAIRLFWTFGAGVLLAFQFLTLCRTAWLSAAVITTVYGIWGMKGVWKEGFWKIMGKGVLLAACALTAFPLVFGGARWLPTILHHPVWYEGEWSENKVHSFDPADSWKYVSMEEFLNAALGRFLQVLELVEDKNPFVLKVHAVETPLLSDDREWTSADIRQAIWKAYWKDLNLRGHSEQEGYYLILSDYRAWHAQNLWLQIAYYYGIPAGILLVVLTAVMLWYYLSRYRKGLHYKQYGIIPILIIVLYFSFGIMETVWNPGQLIFCLVFLVQHPMFRRLPSEESYDTMGVSEK